MSRPADFRSWLSASLALVVLSACAPAKTDVANITAPSASTVIDSPTVPSTPSSLPTLQAAKPSAVVQPKSLTLSTPVNEKAPKTNQLTRPPIAEVPKATETERATATVKLVKPNPQSVAKATTASDFKAPTFRANQSMAGFSPDGSHFMYLESSRDTGAGIPRSTMQVMDLARNTCVENGCVKTNFGEQDADRTTAESEAKLLQQTASLRQTLNMTTLQPGKVLPVQSRTRTPDGAEVVILQVNNKPLQIQLRQATIKSPLRGGTAETDRSAMQLEVAYDGQKRTLDSLNNYRDWVFDYSIREVRLSQDGKTIAILLTATKPTFEGTLATTLVQGLTL